MSLQNFLLKVASGGMEKSIDQLSYNHLDVLLSIWDINRRSDGCTQTETEVSKAFGEEKRHSADEQCVKELFQWHFLVWVKEGKTFRINPALDNFLPEMSRGYFFMNSEMKKENDDEN